MNNLGTQLLLFFVAIYLMYQSIYLYRKKPRLRNEKVFFFLLLSSGILMLLILLVVHLNSNQSFEWMKY